MSECQDAGIGYKLKATDRSRWSLLLWVLLGDCWVKSDVTIGSRPLGRVCTAVVKQRVTFQHRCHRVGATATLRVNWDETLHRCGILR
jgi:hypothetical protein